MKLTKPQLAELKRIAVEPRGTYGSSIARLQNKLKGLGLVEFKYAAGSWMMCSITETGKAYLCAAERRPS